MRNSQFTKSAKKQNSLFAAIAFGFQGAGLLVSPFWVDSRYFLNKGGYQLRLFISVYEFSLLYK
jgi:hypothetical protein